jgi:hypothetical protein
MDNLEEEKDINVEKVKDLKILLDTIKSKLQNVSYMKRKLKVTKYSISLTGNNNNVDVKKLQKAIARELTEISNIKIRIKSGNI